VLQEVSSIAGPVSSGSTDLIINKRQIETSFTVGDGQILAIGGLLSDDERKTIAKIPLLSDIPYLGELFKYRTNSRNKTNLTVFIRPTVLRDRNDNNRMTARRYEYVRAQQLLRNPNMEPGIDELLRDYMGALPPVAPDVGPNDVVVGATDKLERPATSGPLQPAEVPPSNISTTNGGGQ
jgi:general secretion pathway protein D